MKRPSLRLSSPEFLFVIPEFRFEMTFSLRAKKAIRIQSMVDS